MLMTFNPDVLSTATVKNKQVVFESGATYKLLVVPGKTALNPNFQYMSYQTVKKLLDLVKAGATIIVAEKPLYQNGLQQKSQTEFDQLINQIWGGSFEEVKVKKDNHPLIKEEDHNIFTKKIGSGQILKAPYHENNFTEIGIEPDVIAYEFASLYQAARFEATHLAYTHRRSIERYLLYF